MLQVPRFYPDKSQDRASSGTQASLAPKLEPFWQPSRALVWETSKSGLLNDLYFTDQHEVADDVSRGMVEIEPKAFCLNLRDVMVGLGQLDETLVGYDCAGIITRLGPDTEQSRLKVGDRVCGVCKGRFASTAQAYWTGVAKIPNEIPWKEAASIPFAFGTAFIALYNIARLEKGESILIHAADGSVGQTCLGSSAKAFSNRACRFAPGSVIESRKSEGSYTRRVP